MGGCCCNCLSFEFDTPESRRLALAAYESSQTQPDWVEIVEEYIDTPDGYVLYTRTFVPKIDDYKGLIVYNHGYSDHTHFFVRDLASNWAEKGYIFATYDMFGHGKSDGLWCDLYSFDDNYVRDAKLAFDRAQEKYAKPLNLRTFLMGQSLGGAVATKVAFDQQEKYDGLILIAPMVKIADEMYPPWIVIKLLLFLENFIPTWPLVNSQVEGGLTSIPEVLEQWRNDPIVYRHNTRLRTGRIFLFVTDEIMSRVGEITVPILLVHSTADEVTDPNGSERLYEGCSSKIKEFKIFDDQKHMLFDEPRKDEVFETVERWMEERRGDSEDR